MEAKELEETGGTSPPTTPIKERLRRPAKGEPTPDMEETSSQYEEEEAPGSSQSPRELSPNMTALFDLQALIKSHKMEIERWAKRSKIPRQLAKLRSLKQGVTGVEAKATELSSYVHKLNRKAQAEKTKVKVLESGLTALSSSLNEAVQSAIRKITEGITTELMCSLPQLILQLNQTIPTVGSNSLKNIEEPIILEAATQTEESEPPPERLPMEEEDVEITLQEPPVEIPPRATTCVTPPHPQPSTSRKESSPPHPQQATSDPDSPPQPQLTPPQEKPSYSQAAQKGATNTEEDIQAVRTEGGITNSSATPPARTVEGEESREQTKKGEEGKWQTVGKKPQNKKKTPTRLIVLPRRLGMKGETILENLSQLDLPTDLPIQKAQTGRNNVIIICDSLEGAHRVRKTLQANPSFRRNATVELKRDPTLNVIMTRVSTTISEGEVRRKLKEALPRSMLRPNQLRLQKRKVTDRHCNWTVTLPPREAKDLVGKKRILFGLSAAYLQEEARPSRCFRCQQFGHHEETCSFGHLCAVCCGRHPTTACKSNANKCINCWADNYYNSCSHNIYHRADSRTCPSFLRYAQKVRATNDPSN